ncbi:glycoside hydrolase family 3 protein [Nonomuraea endophytica]|uniref:glycoside hydrolase family 3 protein n=1 Tax=Nonomuraea endophytica TaxID=714136 RepID=UPI0037C67585
MSYLNPSLPIEERVDDLLSQMTLEEKAGQLFHTANVMHPDGDLLETPDEANGVRTAAELVARRNITHFNLLNGDNPHAIAEWHNRLQDLAASTRLGIPVTVSTDPRHGLFSSPATGMVTDALSRWPEHTGLAATGSAELVREYGDAVRRELGAMGIRVFLGPMADLYTDPRWSRGYGTFGEDPELAARLTGAFIEGLRGDDPHTEVAAMVKHFPGGGPQKDGNDAHDPRYPEQVYPGSQQNLHLLPFESAFAAGVTQIMTYYGMPVGTSWEEVGFAFNKPVVTGLLREHYGFDGIVCADWNVIEGTMLAGEPFGPNGWGLAHLTPLQRMARALDAGVDQFGGDDNPALVVELVRSGQISEQRVDASVRRLLREKFRLGLFERRHVDVEEAVRVVGADPLRSVGRTAQRQSLVLLQNSGVLPLPSDAKVYTEGLAYGSAVPLHEADVAILRLHAPYEKDGRALSEWFHGGDLRWPGDQIDHVRRIAATLPTVVLVYLERPAILTPLAEVAAAVVGDFGSDDDVLLDLVFGRYGSSGRLPFDLPSSMKAVEESREDVPFDTADPLFRFGSGLVLETGASATGFRDS